MRARTVLTGAIAALSAITFASNAAADAHGHGGHDGDGGHGRHARRDLAVAAISTAWFHDVDVAEAAGYGLPPEGPLHECISAIDAPGAMGLHYINGDFVSDTVLDPARPEALVYEPTSDGGRRLVAVEYVVFAEQWDAQHRRPPRMFGRPMMLVAEPNRYEIPAFYQIHAWIWRFNPAGIHADFNTRVSCSPTATDGGSWAAL